MQQGSLITPTDKFLSEINYVVNIKHWAYFKPKAPEKGDIYLCNGLFNSSYSGKLGVHVDGLECYDSRNGDIINLLAESFVEVQPPMNVQELVEESMSETA